MQDSDNFDATASRPAVKNDMLARGEFAVPITDLVTSLTLARIFRQVIKRTVQQSKVMTALFTPPAFLRITANLTKILKSLPGKQELWH